MMGSACEVDLGREVELWGLLGRGDGVSCPQHDRCEMVGRGEACIDPGMRNGIVALDSAGTMREGGRLWKPTYHCFRCAGQGARPRGRIFALVERLANRLLLEAGVTEPPVSWETVTRFCERAGAEIRLLPLRAYHGALWRTTDAWVVHVNRNDWEGRRRYTLAHELFHVMAHTCCSPVFNKRGRSGGDFNEMIGDYFGACLLLPAAMVGSKHRAGMTPRMMAEVFGAKELAIRRRLRFLGLA